MLSFFQGVDEIVFAKWTSELCFSLFNWKLVFIFIAYQFSEIWNTNIFLSSRLISNEKIFIFHHFILYWNKFFIKVHIIYLKYIRLKSHFKNYIRQNHYDYWKKNACDNVENATNVFFSSCSGNRKTFERKNLLHTEKIEGRWYFFDIIKYTYSYSRGFFHVSIFWLLCCKKIHVIIKYIIETYVFFFFIKTYIYSFMYLNHNLRF